MKKRLILLAILVLITTFSFIPFTQQRTIVIKASFYNVYQQLVNANNWEKWREDLRQIHSIDAIKISENKLMKGFEISYAGFRLHVNQFNGYSFEISEINKNQRYEYSYTLFPEKFPNETTIITTQKTNALNYIVNRLSSNSFSRTHIIDLKQFMENASLYYGYQILKTRVTDTDVIVLRAVVVAENKFKEAAKNLKFLQDFIASNHLKQSQPLIAQFIKKSNDSIQLNIGIPVEKRVLTKNPLAFMMMPKTGYVYSVSFRGKFMDRTQAYTALQQYFNDRQLPVPILPFETYLDNKLPENDTDKVNIRINFPSY